MASEPTRQAARNNARWCDAVCRAHGRPGEFYADSWVNRHETPPYYPNVVTLSPEGLAAQLERIGDLLCGGVTGEWAVKDSFRALDLAPLGFRILFEAEWTYRPASSPRPRCDVAGVRWAKVDRAQDLAAWEAAWSGEPADQICARAAVIFLPGLLSDPDIAVIGAYRDHRLVAGAVANRTEDVVGLSNVFVSVAASEELRAGCVAAAMDAFPGLPLVGYENGEELSAARALGFEALGTLRIWVRAAAREQ